LRKSLVRRLQQPLSLRLDGLITFATRRPQPFHERAPAVPLIAMSGYAFANLNSPAPDFLRMALELGASRCLRKPFTPVALLTVINECLAQAQSRFSSVVQLR
jgi:CheY-like chemotaxis protein